MKKSSILTIVTTFTILGLNAQIINIPADQTTIQQGIDASSDGDTILVQPGTFQENLTINSKNIVLGSLFLTTQDTSYISQTIIDGNLESNVLTISNCDSTLNITGFIIQNGRGEYGAGVNINNSGGILDNLIVKDNVGFDPENQLLGQAPGIYCNIGSGLKLRNIDILNNWSSTQACALWCHGINNGELSNLTIQNNHNALEGISYVVLIQESKLDINNIEIFDNHDFDKIIYFDGTASSYFVDNLLIHDNTSRWVLCGQNTVVYFNNITLANNNADYWLYSEGTFIEFHNSILWNTSNNAIVPDQLYVKIENCCYNNAIDTLGNISNNPMFVDELNNDYSLSPCSPCIGDGSPLYGGVYDINNEIRPNPSGSNPDMGVFEDSLGSPLTPPTITSQPVGTEICENGSYTLSIEADGSPVLYYQWQMDNVGLDGETNSYLILNNLTQANEGNYRCLVSNSCETISSNNVFINVLASPSVTQQPTDKYVYVGNGISFELAVTGDEPLNYQWYGPSGILSGDTLDYLLLTNINYSDTGYYYCSITNTCGTENTNNALLTVYDQLTVDAGNDLSIPIGTDTILNGSFQGGSPSIGYYWTPDSLLVNPNVLNPQTLNLFEAHTFTLNVFDSIVDYNTSDNILITVVENDTLNYNTFGSDTMYEYNVTRSNCGYVAGNNCDNDLIKAQYFYDDVKLFEINEILLHFGKAIKTSEEEIPIKIGIWDNTGDDNNPGTILTSAYIPLSDIVEDVKNERLSSLVLTEPIKVSNGFYIGVFLPETEGDTVVLFTNKDGESQPNLSWTQKNGYEWSSYSQDPRWYLNVSNAIFPIVKQINLSINNITASENEYLVYPNPASNRVIIEAQKQTSGDTELMLLDLQGRVLEQKKFTISTNLHLQNLNPGIYLLSIIKSNGNEVHKIIIQ